MIAIKTKYLAPTNFRGARIKATAADCNATISYNHELNSKAAHFEAVKELVAKHWPEWDISKMVYGTTDSGYVFCFPESIIEA